MRCFLKCRGRLIYAAPRLVMLQFSPYAPPQGHVKASSQYRDCISGRTGFNLSSGLDACDVPETAARARPLVDVVGYALGVRRLDILLVNGRWPSLPNSHLVAAMDFLTGGLPFIYSPYGFSSLARLLLGWSGASKCLRWRSAALSQGIGSKSGISPVFGGRPTVCRSAAPHSFSKVAAFPPLPSPVKRNYRKLAHCHNSLQFPARVSKIMRRQVCGPDLIHLARFSVLIE